MSGVQAAIDAQNARAKADWATYQGMLRANSDAPADVEALHALATKLGRADSLALDHEAVRQFDLAKSKISAGLLTAFDAAKHAAAIHREETTPQAIGELKAKQAAELKALEASHAAEQAKLDAAIFHAHNAHKAGVDAVNKLNSLARDNPLLFSGEGGLSVGNLK